jgi:hypothetical protein
MNAELAGGSVKLPDDVVAVVTSVPTAGVD